jgi:hypothetical protein
MLDEGTEEPGSTTYPAETPEAAVAKARTFWGDPDLSAPGIKALQDFARGAIPSDGMTWQHAQRQNALRQLVAAAPDYQTS